MGFGFDDLLSIPTAGAYTAAKQATGFKGLGPQTTPGAVADGAGGLVDDYMNVGKNHAQPNSFQYTDPTWGGSPGQADYFANQGLNMAGAAQNVANGAGNSAQWAAEAMRGGYGPQQQAFQAQSNPGQVAQEYASRGIQSNALGMAQDAAQGNAPSVAQGMMNQGLNTAMANQQAIAGGARGAGALALAGTNMAANNANLQANAFSQGGQLRAQEMATARDQFGNLSGQQRQQDQTLMGQGNQMNQYNATNQQNANQQNLDRDVTFRTGMGGVANQFTNNQSNALATGTNALGTAMKPYDTSQDAAVKMQGLRGTSYDTNQQTLAGISGANAAAKAGQQGKVVDAFTGFLSNGLKK